MRILSTTVLPALLLLTPSLRPAEWPQWRGPNRDGLSRETGLLKAWPDGGPPLLFTARGLGKGYATVSIAGGRIFTMGERKDGSELIALSERDGKELWSVRIGKPGAPGWGGFRGPRSTPTVDGGEVFALSQYGELAACDAESGRVLWRKHLAGDLGGELPEWGFSESPLADGDIVVVTPGGPEGTLAALDRKTGDVIWRSKEWKDPAQYASIIAVEHLERRQYIQLTMRSLAGVDAASGKLLWRADWPGRTAVIPTPVFENGLCYATAGYGVGCNLFRIEDGFKVRAVYDSEARRAMKNHHGGVVLVDGHIYGYSDGGGWVCQELSTGKVVWRERRRLGKGSITYADGRLYLRSEGGKGTVALIEASPEGYREHGRFDQPERSDAHTWAHPVVAGGRLYLRDQDVLLAYDVRAR